MNQLVLQRYMIYTTTLGSIIGACNGLSHGLHYDLGLKKETPIVVGTSLQITTGIGYSICGAIAGAIMTPFTPIWGPPAYFYYKHNNK